MSTKRDAATKELRDAIEDYEASRHELVETVRRLARQGIDIDLLDGGSELEEVNDLIAYTADTA